MNYIQTIQSIPSACFLAKSVVVSTPFHPKGSMQDDVSLFQIERTVTHLQRLHRAV